MVLGYVLLCGLAPTTPGVIGGCFVLSSQYPTVAACEEARFNFYSEVTLPDGVYEDDSDCFVIGAST